jgi:glycosyltransferase involved in cell wall biosynthesis
MKNKILIVYDVSYPHTKGGGQKRLYEVAKRLISSNWEVDWVCFKTWNDPDSILNSDGIRFLGLPGYNGLYTKNGTRRLLEPFEFAYSLISYNIDYSKYDVIWSGQWPLIHLLWWNFTWTKFNLKKLYVDWWEIWGDTWLSYSPIFGYFGLIIEKLLMNRLHANANLIYISESGAIQAQNLIGKNNHAIIHNGIDFNAIRNIPKTHQLYDIVFLGRLKDHKRVDLLLHAIDRLRSSHLPSLQVALIGDGPERHNLEKLTADLNLQRYINFIGEIKDNHDIYKILHQSKILVNPSVKEGGGSIVLLEAFAAGLPAIAFDCKDGIDPKLVGNGHTGILVSPVSADSLALAIMELLHNPNLLESMSMNAAKKAQLFDWQNITDQYIKYFDKN